MSSRLAGVKGGEKSVFPEIEAFLLLKKARGVEN